LVISNSLSTSFAYDCTPMSRGDEHPASRELGTLDPVR
jgi:hypothetical protein